MKIIIIIILLFPLLVAGGGETGKRGNMLGFKLRSLKTDETVDLGTYRGKWLFMLLFKENCKWCARALHTYEVLTKGESGDKLNVIAIGIGADPVAMRRMGRGISYPVLLADHQLKRALGEVKVTPYTLVADPQGNFKTKLVGYQKEDALAGIVHQLLEDKK